MKLLMHTQDEADTFSMNAIPIRGLTCLFAPVKRRVVKLLTL